MKSIFLKNSQFKEEVTVEIIRHFELNSKNTNNGTQTQNLESNIFFQVNILGGKKQANVLGNQRKKKLEKDKSK